ncbi:hypothetical protein WG66_005794 [Moniliophthora roreri]|nr:hypothetical protein WG66_005794 [Moniliophthora roreri]
MSLSALPATYGALLLGSLIASALSGAVVIHTILYFRVYPSDPPRFKALVILIWFSYFLYSWVLTNLYCRVLDTCHTSFIWSALWAFFVNFYGQIDKIDYVPQQHSPSAFTVSGGNWMLTAPVVILALLRLGTAAGLSFTLSLNSSIAMAITQGPSSGDRRITQAFVMSTSKSEIVNPKGTMTELTLTFMSLPATYGALLLGSLIASACILRILQGSKFWVLDTCHTSFIWSALWAFCVKFYGQIDKIDYVPQQHSPSAFIVSDGNWILTAPISTTASTAELLILHSFSEFVDRDGWIFTLGLSSSSAVDVIITASLIFYLWKSGRGSLGRTSVVIDTLIKYTFETASLTSLCIIALGHIKH